MEAKTYFITRQALYNGRYGRLKELVKVSEFGTTTYDFISFDGRSKEEEIRALKNSIGCEEERQRKTGISQGGLIGKREKLLALEQEIIEII